MQLFHFCSFFSQRSIRGIIHVARVRFGWYIISTTLAQDTMRAGKRRRDFSFSLQRLFLLTLCFLETWRDRLAYSPLLPSRKMNDGTQINKASNQQRTTWQSEIMLLLLILGYLCPCIFCYHPPQYTSRYLSTYLQS